MNISFSDAEIFEDIPKQLIGSDFTGYLAQIMNSLPDIDSNQDLQGYCY